MLLKILFTLLAAGTSVHSEEQSQSGKFCQPITKHSICEFPANTGYSMTHFPNQHGRNQDEAIKHVEMFHPLMKVSCHADMKLFVCSRYVPLCREDLKTTIPPCRSLCEDVREGCSPLMNKFGFKWPFNCTNFPKDFCVSSNDRKDVNETLSTATPTKLDKTKKFTSNRKGGMFQFV